MYTIILKNNFKQSYVSKYLSVCVGICINKLGVQNLFQKK